MKGAAGISAFEKFQNHLFSTNDNFPVFILLKALKSNEKSVLKK